ncbi:hypothetical protein DYBT9275_00358 [Dyadobacter sp. CECT 9275]|uniref:Uncharacterized protein n=1 Tax=Dyadobacter helix TaxID=2822344 RepID=A0A916J877_9BACT|nr:hypothetical protein [Dyadobacter sp. CECT 9275]CAG4989726.1 hypothetical protein DYBT9275_00358 [Dyadobacter sp. CECT 9275]
MNNLIKATFYVLVGINLLIVIAYSILALKDIFFPTPSIRRAEAYVLLVGCFVALASLGCSYYYSLIQNKVMVGFAFVICSYVVWPVALIISLFFFSKGPWH